MTEGDVRQRLRALMLARADVRWHKAAMICCVTAAAARDDEGAPADPGFGVYVHWPLGLSKCPAIAGSQQSRCAAVATGGALPAPPAFRAEIAHRASLVARPGRALGVFRRRHAVAHAPANRARRHRRDLVRLGASSRTPRSRSKPTRPASKRGGFADIAPPASTACRSACRR